jgi:hypothetical protein
MEGALPIIFLAVILKIPVFFALWLIWWAVRAEPEIADDPELGDEHPFRRWRRSPRGPLGPRRGPHGGAARAEPDCPPGGRRRVTAPAQPLPALSGHERRERTPAAS